MNEINSKNVLTALLCWHPNFIYRFFVVVVVVVVAAVVLVVPASFSVTGVAAVDVVDVGASTALVGDGTLTEYTSMITLEGTVTVFSSVMIGI